VLKANAEENIWTDTREVEIDETYREMRNA
jgi:hypothetical protein